ncbi:hypothetical protein UAW_00631 [Enterococcus haemoperoxidus ATCC BAA-382]|uniref:Barstar (barnase inhibitor) domain-containing protein n=1 Tax=Enterococcus haemoperoxidus ATCC BAA-382 TaxID=1158608 RepID=R2THA2_9ENTE|nr:barstar family protein [Enterococcus haemoperoxidus]EOH99479.1 hypothetical protein UAW_00631 [Enterococcus haemoperoxidus ATCC BAA-382]EOT62781.1 hypothetical protein I583_01782 [Enterococcus haemoperoxidus ATCC BAA-382]OJG55251.1 hypothetical protein RV06_GL002288 [Enterococcus haemoperoxidus]
MKNTIHKITIKDIKEIEYKELNDYTHYVKIDGSKIDSWQTFKEDMIRKFKLPMGPDGNANEYLDWMRDLSWLKKRSYVLVICNYDEFLSENSIEKKNIMNDFSEYILPFWESEVEQVVVDGVAKSFQLYLID